MRNRKIIVILSVLVLPVLCFLLGCDATGNRRAATAAPAPGPQPAPREPTTPAVDERPMPNQTAEQLRGHVLANSQSFQSLRADVDCTIRSPLFSSQEVVQYEGTLEVAHPQKVKLVLLDGGGRAIELTGDGKHYVVDMPGIGRVYYTGAYGAPLKVEAGRLAFMPDDLAEAIDQTGLLTGEELARKTFPWWWRLEGFRTDGDTVVPSGSYWISRREPPPDQLVPVVMTYHKFDYPSGDVRAMVTLRDHKRVIDRAGGRICVLPHEMTIAYPNEGTLIGMKLRNVSLNIPLSDKTFAVPESASAKDGTQKVGAESGGAVQ